MIYRDTPGSSRARPPEMVVVKRVPPPRFSLAARSRTAPCTSSVTTIRSVIRTTQVHGLFIISDMSSNSSAPSGIVIDGRRLPVGGTQRPRLTSNTGRVHTACEGHHVNADPHRVPTGLISEPPDAVSRVWVHSLTSAGPEREDSARRLHALLPTTAAASRATRDPAAHPPS